MLERTRTVKGAQPSGVKIGRRWEGGVLHLLARALVRLVRWCDPSLRARLPRLESFPYTSDRSSPSAPSPNHH